MGAAHGRLDRCGFGAWLSRWRRRQLLYHAGSALPHGQRARDELERAPRPARLRPRPLPEDRPLRHGAAEGCLYQYLFGLGIPARCDDRGPAGIWLGSGTPCDRAHEWLLSEADRLPGRLWRWAVLQQNTAEDQAGFAILSPDEHRQYWHCPVRLVQSSAARSERTGAAHSAQLRRRLGSSGEP